LILSFIAIILSIIESQVLLLLLALTLPDHVHLLIDLHPDNNISDLIASLKSASSRILREKYKPEIDKYYWGKAKLWHESKCIVSCGGAPLDTVKEYIQAQSGGRLEKSGASNP